MNSTLLIKLISILLISTFSIFRLRVFMLFFQQNEYMNKSFFDLVCKKLKLIDKKLTLILFVVYFLPVNHYTKLFLIFISFLSFSFFENKVVKNAKKKLVITQRVKRILGVASILNISILIFLNFYLNNILANIVLLQIMPFILILSNIILSPYEKKLQNFFLDDAKNILKKCNPITIAITGSYGKTSTKHILGHILSGNLPVLITPGSVNTDMGICKTIREKLEPQHKYFIAEIGAYFKGSIKRKCDFINPKHGIITAIGQAHYEHFKTQEIVASTKFELGEFVQKNNGFLIINKDEIKDEFIPKNMPLTKVGKGTEIFASNIKQNIDGLSFIYHRDGKELNIFAPIFGLHHVQNIVLAITTANFIGMDLESIVLMLKTLPQISHRLEVKKQDNGIIIIDDAYNSNIIGFKSGLDLLQKLNAKRRILITPGMVELGSKHDEQHKDIGEYAADKVDIAIIVAPKRIKTFIDNFNSKKNNNSILIEVDNFKEASEWMQNNLQSGDVVLLENDLPDLYESKFQL